MTQHESPSGSPYVSVVVAVFNRANTLQHALDSLFSQTYREWELVVIDGGSTDGSVDILERASDRISYWVSEPDRGIYDAWNKALPRLRGQWVMFLGSDDYLADPTVLARMEPHLRAAEARTRVVYGRIERVDWHDNSIATVGSPWPDARAALRRGMSIPHPATFHHRTLFSDLGPFDAMYRISGDYEFLLRELLDRDATYVADVTVTRMRIGGTSDDAEPGMREVHRARRAHGLTRMPEALPPRLIEYRARRLAHRLVGARATRSLSKAYRALFPR